MCIIVTKERNAKPLDESIFENCWNNNPDGAGILFHDGKTSTLIKGIMNKSEFLEKIKLANKQENSFIIHTRIATHGSIKPENTHPFVSDTLGFAHNGTMPIEPLKDRTDSESFFLWTIAEKDFQWCKENKFLLDLATHGSKCVIFDMRTGELLHLCEEDWKKDEKYEGALFSNTTYSYKRYIYSEFGKEYKGKGYNYQTNTWEDDLDSENWDDIAYTKEYEQQNKKTFDKIQAVCLKRTKKGILSGISTWVEMYLDNFAEKGGTDKRLMIQKIRELEETITEYIKISGKYDLEINAINVLKKFIAIANAKGYNDYKSVLNAFKEFSKGILAENKETELFIEELDVVRRTYA